MKPNKIYCLSWAIEHLLDYARARTNETGFKGISADDNKIEIMIDELIRIKRELGGEHYDDNP